MRRVALAAAFAGTMAILAPSVRGQLFNYAAARHGAVASSNGDLVSKTERHPAAAAIDGTRDMSRYADGGVWLGSTHVTDQTPAIWQVTFPRVVKVNRVVIYHLPVGRHYLVDFTLEYRSPGSRQFKPVRPYGNQWRNPLRDNSLNVSKLTFDVVETDSLRLVITKADPEAIAQHGYGQAYIAEFEAYLVDVEQEQQVLQRQRQAFAEIGKLAKKWRAERQQREKARLAAQAKADATVTEAGSFAWVRREKIRTSHTGLGVKHLSELMPELSRLGFNAIDPGGRRYASKPEGWEPAVRGVNELAEKYNMHVTLWFAWYWYKNDKNFPDRNCMPDLTREGQYRRAVDFRGTTMKFAPCPLSDQFWRDIRANVRQVARWSVGYPRIWGICLDFEFYGTGSSRQPSDWYGYDFCFCDRCFGLFLQRIGSKIKACQIPAEKRFERLKEVGAVEAYYEMLTDEVRHRAENVRQAAHAINRDFVLQFYGVPILPEPQVAQKLDKNFLWNSWFGYGLAQGFGTKRLPCVYKPLDASDPRPGRWTLTARMVREGQRWKFVETGKSFQQQYRELGLHVVHIPGVVICNESPSADMARAIRTSLVDGDGFWFNEGWMLLAFRNPDHPAPAWWSEKNESIDVYWKMLENVLSNAVSQGGKGGR